MRRSIPTEFYDPATAAKSARSPEMATAMDHIRTFTFDNGLMGNSAKSKDAIGITLPGTTLGDPANVKLTIDDSLHADGRRRKTLARKHRASPERVIGDPYDKCRKLLQHTDCRHHASSAPERSAEQTGGRRRARHGGPQLSDLCTSRAAASTRNCSKACSTPPSASSRLPFDEKMKVYIGNSRNHRGYVPEGEEVFASGTKDKKEAYDLSIDLPADDPDYVAGNPLLGPNQWPDLPGFAEAVNAYYTCRVRHGPRAAARVLDGDRRGADVPRSLRHASRRASFA